MTKLGRGLAIVVCAASGCISFVAGCAGQPSPIAPEASSGVSSSLPGGQTHIRGLVSDTVRRPLPGALIAVLDGPLAGATTLTDAEGKFELTGTTAGTATLRVSRDGFQAKTQSLLWRTPTSGIGIDGYIRLDALEPPIGLDPGDYTLTIAIDLATAVGHPGIPKASCAGFPGNLASFTYQVQILEGNSGRYVRADEPPPSFRGVVRVFRRGTVRRVRDRSRNPPRLPWIPLPEHHWSGSNHRARCRHGIVGLDPFLR